MIAFVLHESETLAYGKSIVASHFQATKNTRREMEIPWLGSWVETQWRSSLLQENCILKQKLEHKNFEMASSAKSILKVSGVATPMPARARTQATSFWARGIIILSQSQG